MKLNNFFAYVTSVLVLNMASFTAYAGGGFFNNNNFKDTINNIKNIGITTWAPRNGALPNGAVEIGTQGDGAKTYICRAPVTNGVITGKLAWGNTCFYAFFGKEYSTTQGYEVLINNNNDSNLKWRPWNGGADWDVGRGGNRKALVGGSYDNKPIVPCRANFKGGMVGGHFHGNTCFLPHYGLENPVSNFELLGY